MSKSDSSSPTPTPSKRSLPIRPNLERLRNEAKQRLKTLRVASPATKLTEAQFALAREYGFPSWRALKAYVEAVVNPPIILQASDTLVSAANRKDIVRVREILKQATPGQHDLDLALARGICGGGGRNTRALRYAIADLLIEVGANPNGQYGGNYGPIVFAVCEGVDVDGLEYLLAHGADVSFEPIPTKYGLMTPFFHAAWTYVRGSNASRHRCLDLLIEHGAVHQDDVFLAILRGDRARLAGFLDADPGLITRRFPELAGRGNPDLAGATLLHFAIDFGETECVDLLLDRGADINARAEPREDGTGTQTPLFHAVQSWKGAHFKLLRHLLERESSRIDWSLRAMLAPPDHTGASKPQWLTAVEYAACNARETRLLSRFGAPAAPASPAPVVAPEAAKGFLDAINEGEIDTVHRLLHEHPELTNSHPWSPRWEGTAVEGIAFKCVWHRPRMHEIAQLLVDHGTDADLPSLARCGLKEEVIRRIEDEPELLNQPDAEGRTALYRAACVYGAFPEGEAVADELIRRGAEIDLWTACTLGLLNRVRECLQQNPKAAKTTDPEGMTALHWACRNRRHPERSAEIVRLLCEAGADVEAVNPKEEEMRPLHHCGEWSSTPETAEVLLRFGADINAPAADGWTPLEFAIDRGRHPMIAFLTGKGGKRAPEQDDLPRRFLRAISESTGEDLASLKTMVAGNPELISQPAPHPLWGGTPQALHVAIERGNRPIFDWLIAAGADIDGKDASYDGWTPLLLALHNRRRAMAQTLVQRGAFIGLPEALMLGDDARVEAFLKSDPESVTRAFPSLASPIRFARTTAAAQRLLALGAPLDRKDRFGQTPLESIVSAGPETVAETAPLLRLLLEQGAEAPPWVYAALGDLARLQAAAEFDPEIARDPATAVAAIQAGQTTVVEWMLTQGLPVNGRNADQSKGTLLHAAAWHGQLSLVKILLANGADSALTDEEHRTTPAQWAETAFLRLGRKECKAVADWLAKAPHS